MNHLAHIYFSLEDPDLMTGNFMGDYIMNRELDSLDTMIRSGVILHRFIDTESDMHPVFRTSTARLHKRQGKYAPVVVDLFYDHFLSRHWEKFSDTPLKETAILTYSILENNMDKMPLRIRERLPRMIQGRFLERYAKLDQMASAFMFLARRAKFQSRIEEAHLDLERDYKQFEADFLIFFPEMIRKVEEWKSINLQNEEK